MTICKDKNSIKYFVLASVILLCLYTNSLAGLFSPIFANIYYGNLVATMIGFGITIILCLIDLKREFKVNFTPLEKSIRGLYDYYVSNKELIDISKLLEDK